jgi:hypothetical protein
MNREEHKKKPQEKWNGNRMPKSDDQLKQKRILLDKVTTGTFSSQNEPNAAVQF